jgi:hypothetical protein
MLISLQLIKMHIIATNKNKFLEYMTIKNILFHFFQKLIKDIKNSKFNNIKIKNLPKKHK